MAPFLSSSILQTKYLFIPINLIYVNSFLWNSLGCRVVQRLQVTHQYTLLVYNCKDKKLQPRMLKYANCNFKSFIINCLWHIVFMRILVGTSLVVAIDLARQKTTRPSNLMCWLFDVLMCWCGLEDMRMWEFEDVGAENIQPQLGTPVHCSA